MNGTELKDPFLEKTNKQILTELCEYASGDLSEVIAPEYADIMHFTDVETAYEFFLRFRGDRINYPCKFFKDDFIVKTAAAEPKRSERSKIAVLFGYSTDSLEKKVKKFLAEQGKEGKKKKDGG